MENSFVFKKSQNLRQKQIFPMIPWTSQNFQLLFMKEFL